MNDRYAWTGAPNFEVVLQQVVLLDDKKAKANGMINCKACTRKAHGRSMTNAIKKAVRVSSCLNTCVWEHSNTSNLEHIQTSIATILMIAFRYR